MKFTSVVLPVLVAVASPAAALTRVFISTASGNTVCFLFEYADRSLTIARQVLTGVECVLADAYLFDGILSLTMSFLV